MNERKQIYLATTLRIILSIILVILGVLSLVFLHGYRFSYTIYVPVLLGCIAVALFLLCSCFMLGIFCHKNIKQEKIKGINEKQRYFIRGDDLVIYYELYDIAPYVAGIPEFNISLEKFNSSYKYVTAKV